MATRACVILAVALAASVAGATPPRDSLEPDPERVLLPIGRAAAVALPGSWRLYDSLVSGVSVAAEDPAVGATTPETSLIESRLRLQPTLLVQSRGFFKLWRLTADGELHVTLAESTRPPVGLEADERWQFIDDQPVLRLTRLNLVMAAEHLLIKAGLERSHFGLGLLANDGEDAPPGITRESPFGISRQGDQVLRGQITVLPQGVVVGQGGAKPPIALTVAIDAIIDDDTAAWFDGDRAYQALAGVQLAFDAGQFALGLAQRRQTHADGGETLVNIGLVGGSAAADLGGGRRLFGEVEAAGYAGHTDFVQSVVRPGNYSILSAGGALRGGVEAPRYNALVEVGFASGDANGFDDELHGFSFDRDYRLGLLMFSEVVRATTAVAAHNVADPRFRGQPPRGYDSLASDGAVTNARYVNPRMSWTPGADLTLHLGYLFATTDEPYADPFRSGLAGGAAVGPRGALDQSVLGQEVDVAMSWEPRWTPIGARVALQVAWFQPGAVFDAPDAGAAEDVTGGFLHVEGWW